MNVIYSRYEGPVELYAKKDGGEVHSPEMDEQVFRLKLITSKLVEAYNGRDVSWIDEGQYFFY